MPRGQSRDPAAAPRFSSRTRRYAGCAFLAAVTIVSVLLPPRWKGRVSSTGFVHGCEHIAVFWVAFLLWISPAGEFRKDSVRALALLAFGLTLELLQTVIYGSRFEFADLFWDCLGIAIGLIVRRHRSTYLREE
jgi:hypothetical protein